ncbi:sortase B [Lachnospiraceae bacterium PF1-21]
MKKILMGMLIAIAGVLIAVGAFQIYKKFDQYRESSQTSQKMKDVAGADVMPSDVVEEWQPDWEALKSVNQDIVAWIRFTNGLSVIDYPVLQRDNQFYLNHLADGTWNEAGAVFLNKDNSKDFSDFNSIIYAHDMYDGTLFGGLDKYRDYNFYAGNSSFIIYLDNGEKLEYQVWNVAIVSYNDSIYTNIYNGKDEQKAYIADSKSKGLYETGISPEVESGSEPNIVTLSTCTGRYWSERFIIQGYKVKQL